MIALRPASERGHANHGWLDSHHSFSFADYYDAAHMGFGPLRVINEDRVQPGMGFGTHGHRDMEILSWVAEGSLEHKDSLGTGSVIRPGDLQRMSAGKGVRHSEFNPSPSERTRLLQIWLLPSRSGLEPSYEQKNFPVEGRTNRLLLIAAPESSGDAVSLHQDAELWTALLDPGRSVKHEFRPGRHGWLQVVRGELEANGQLLEQGDGVALSDEKSLEVRAKSAAEFLLFDLA
ncbi:MAG: pirin family protein [Planctomycetota bacterium]